MAITTKGGINNWQVIFILFYQTQSTKLHLILRKYRNLDWKGFSKTSRFLKHIIKCKIRTIMFRPIRIKHLPLHKFLLSNGKKTPSVSNIFRLFYLENQILGWMSVLVISTVYDRMHSLIHSQALILFICRVNNYQFKWWICKSFLS